MGTFLIAILTSFVISLIITPVVRNFFIKRNWVEDPVKKNKKTHNATAISSVPRGGGIPIFISVLISALIMIPLDKHLIGILLAALVALIIGLWDDLKDISPLLRLFSNIFIALIIVASGT